MGIGSSGAPHGIVRVRAGREVDCQPLAPVAIAAVVPEAAVTIVAEEHRHARLARAPARFGKVSGEVGKVAHSSTSSLCATLTPSTVAGVSE